MSTEGIVPVIYNIDLYTFTREACKVSKKSPIQALTRPGPASIQQGYHIMSLQTKPWNLSLCTLTCTMQYTTNTPIVNSATVPYVIILELLKKFHIKNVNSI